MKELARAETPNPEGIGGRAGKVVTSGRATQQSPYASTLNGMGMSRQQAHRVANVPEADFEAAA